jgi:hypothetical protein
MMKTGGCRPRPQLACCAKGSPERSLAQKVAMQVAAVAQASRILKSPISSTLRRFTRQNPLVTRDGSKVHAVNARSPISRNLRARPDPYPRGILCMKEEYLFFPDEPFTMLVNEAIDLKRDETLRAEVFRYRNVRHTLAEKAEVLGRLHHEFKDTQRDLRDSLKALSSANAFKRIEPCVQYEVAIDDTLPVDTRLAGINKMNDPWAEGPCEVNIKCLWCRRLGHATHNCQMLHQCVLCWGRGHLEARCRWPHAKCVEGKTCVTLFCLLYDMTEPDSCLLILTIYRLRYYDEA